MVIFRLTLIFRWRFFLLNADPSVDMTGGFLDDAIIVDARYDDVQLLLVDVVVVAAVVRCADDWSRSRSLNLGFLLRAATQDVLQLLFLVGQASGGREDQQKPEGQISKRPIHFKSTACS